jgi:hypothetical protein
VIIIFGSNATFDAGQKGRFFSGHGSKGKASLELHSITLKNGKVDGDVSEHLKYFSSILHFRAYLTQRTVCFFAISGNFLHFPMGSMSWRGTCNYFRVALFTLTDSTVLLKSRFMTALLQATPPPL